MNKTVNINLGGFFYHIDEDAYQKLNRYFEAIKSSLSHESRDEVMSDIESRISELFSEKIEQSNQVLSLKDIDDVIAVMGQPEDYKIEGEDPKNNQYSYSQTRSKKLYRDKETSVVAGVCSGLGHYFGVDAVWIRVALILLVFAGFGTGIIAYIVLWAVTPEAVTTSEKLEMTGEPITISNIERKVREEFDSVSEKFKNADYSKIGNNFKSGAQKAGNGLGDVIVAIAKAFAKLIGAIMVLIGSITIISLLISMFTLGSTSFVQVPWMDYYNSFNYTNTSLWFISLLFFLAIGIPFFFLMLLGLKILVNNMRSIGNIAKYTLLAVWLLAISGLIILGVQTSNEFAFENKVVNKTRLSNSASDTLVLKFRHSEYYAKDVDRRIDFKPVQDSVGNDFIYSTNVRLEILPTDQDKPFIQIERMAKGKTFSDARENAKGIRYNFKNNSSNPNEIVFDNYFLVDSKNKFRDQEVKIYLYLPKGYHVKPDSSLENYDVTDSDYFTFYPESNDYVYKVEDHKIRCLNCPKNLLDDDDNNDDDEEWNKDDTSVIINEEGIKIKKDSTISNTKEIKELKINENGIIIKTK